MKQVRFLRKAATPPEVKLPEGSRRTPPEVKLHEGRSLPSESRYPARGEASRRKRRTPFLREDAEGRPSFGRKPKDGNKFASFGKPPEVKLPEGLRRTRFFQNKLLPSGTSGASIGKPPEVKLPEGRPSFGRTRFFQNKFR